VLAIQACLLPINIFRLAQMKAVIRKLGNTDVPALESLAPYLKTERLGDGDVLFRVGESADALYIVQDGTVRLEGLERSMGPGELIGEIGVFGASRKRTATAVAGPDTIVRCLPGERVRELYVQTPEFALAILRVVLERMQAPELADK
jgi:CRP-like cAMP-binding protein